jgi:hypothetical protein
MKKNLVIAILIASIVSCGPSTKIVNSWRDPNTVVNTSELHKFVVAALLKNEATRREVEDKMAALNPGKAVPSYQVFGTTPLTQTDDVYMKKLKDDGYDGIVIMRLAKVDKDQRYVPGNSPTYYGSWRGYYGNAWGGYYDPGYYTTDKTFYVEVNVYSLPKDKLVWSGVTSTINPSSGQSLFDGVISAVEQKMKDEGFLVKPAKK